jgi:integrase
MTKAIPTVITQLDCEQADAAIRDGKPKPHLLTCGGGLALQITPGKEQNDGSYALAKSWLFCYRGDDGAHRMGLGPFAFTVPDYPNAPKALTLAEAQVQARIHSNQLKDGTDPLTHEQTKKLERLQSAPPKARKTFQAVTDEYMDKHETGWSSPVYKVQWRETMRLHVYPKIGKIPVAHITDEHVLQVLEPLWRAQKTNTGKSVMQRIAKVLGYAIARKYRKGPNPAAWRDNLQHSLSKPRAATPHPALDYHRVGEFMARLRDETGIAARALEMTVLTASRTSEVRLAKWSEIDLERRLWTVPKERMKMRDKQERGDHIVPLSEPVIALLKAIKGDKDPDPNNYIFRGRTGPHLAQPPHVLLELEPGGAVRRSYVVDFARSGFSKRQNSD